MKNLTSSKIALLFAALSFFSVDTASAQTAGDEWRNFKGVMESMGCEMVASNEGTQWNCPGSPTPMMAEAEIANTVAAGANMEPQPQPAPCIGADCPKAPAPEFNVDEEGTKCKGRK